jgi:NADH-quinone oxidoreductase subunit J
MLNLKNANVYNTYYFLFLSAITLATAFLTIFSKNLFTVPLPCNLFFSIAGHYLLNSQFLAIVHIIVYSGAIMILFLFTIMFMNLNKENEVHKPRITRLGAIVSLCLISVVLIFIFINSKPIAGNILVQVKITNL